MANGSKKKKEEREKGLGMLQIIVNNYPSHVGALLQYGEVMREEGSSASFFPFLI